MVGRKRAGSCIVGLAAFVALSLAISSASAEPGDEYAGQYGAAFLRVPIGARAMILPDVVMGMRPDASMLFSNPAPLGVLGQDQVFLTTAKWLDEFNVSAGSFAMPIQSVGLTWSLGARLLYLGDIKGYDTNAQIVSEDSYYDMALSTGVSKSINSLGLSFGAAVDYLREHQPTDDGSGYSFSAGAAFQRGGHRVEFAAKDFIGKLAFDDRSYDIDRRYVLGYGYLFRRTWGDVVLGTEATFAGSEYDRLQLGLAYHMNQFLTLRSGFDHTADETSKGGMPLGGGFGVHFGALTLDYAFTPQEYFSETHTFSVTFAFGGEVEPTSPDVNRKASPKAATSTAPTASQSPSKNAPKSAPVAVTEAGTVKREPNPAAVSSTDPREVASPDKKSGEDGISGRQAYSVVAGSHSRLSSAEDEVRALRLLKIPAVAQRVGKRYQVVIERYDSLREAEDAVERFRKKGHQFKVVETPR